MMNSASVQSLARSVPASNVYGSGTASAINCCGQAFSAIMTINFVKRYRLSRTFVGSLMFIFAISTAMLIYMRPYETAEVCPLSGPGSSAPLNEKEFMTQLDGALFVMKRVQETNGKFDGNVISTCINKEAAIHNFPPFLLSITSVQPPLMSSLVVFCLDSTAFEICKASIPSTSCVYMDLGIAGDSLAPGGQGKQNDDYWRLTYGRVFATKALIRRGINAVPVDVDAVFLQNPFNLGNGISERPNDVAVVSDIAPFTFTYGDKTPINGGFLYFPGVVATSLAFSRDIVNRIWAKNCHPKSNEQLVTSSVLRYMRRRYGTDPTKRAYMLPVEQYLNFCSTTCGAGLEFSSIRSVQDLRQMETRHSRDANFSSCSAEGRKNWVYFHAACINKDQVGQSDVAQVKARVQLAVYQWVKDTEKLVE